MDPPALLMYFIFRHKISDEDFDFQISLIQHSSGAPHPAAAKPIFSVFRTSAHPTQLNEEILISGENLVLSLGAPFKTLHFYNWQTGKHKSVR